MKYFAIIIFILAAIELAWLSYMSGAIAGYKTARNDIEYISIGPSELWFHPDGELAVIKFFNIETHQK
jgi:hypothetical protein